jgi:hypothetical protein
MLPNFIVIGAAKAGTTALYWYLAEHPRVFMSPVKETNYFAYNLDESGQLLYGDPTIHRFPIRTLSEYEGLFASAGDAKAVGEASPLYLESPQAAARIARLIPEARIICGIRQPVDRAYSDYQMYLRNRSRWLEPARDFSATAHWARPDSHWMQLGRYHAQLARYYEVFPRHQIHVFLFDDMKRDALRTTQEIYRFVGVDPAFRPDLETPHNIGGVPANMLLERLVTNKALRSMMAPLMSLRAANWVRKLRTRNMKQAPRLPAELRKELTSYFQDDILKTSDLIGKKLDHWLSGPVT